MDSVALGDGGMEKELHGCAALLLNIVGLFLSIRKRWEDFTPPASLCPFMFPFLLL